VDKVVIEETALERETMRRVTARLIPFLFILYVFNFLDRTNVALAALQMNRDLHFSSSAFGLGAGIFFLGYAILEVPSNLILARVGARRWIARIMITWGIIACGMMFVRTPMHFYILRFLLGVAEAGFFPGIVFYLTKWFPAPRRARAQSRFMSAIPLSGVLGGLIGGFLLSLDGKMGLAGWQWLFLVEGLPSVIMGFVVLFYLTDEPSHAKWLSDDQRSWLIDRMQRDRQAVSDGHSMSVRRALSQPAVWALAIPYFLVLTTGYTYTFWSPTVFKESLHTSNTQTALLTAFIAVVSMVFMLVVAASSDRRNERFFHAAINGALIAIGFAGAALIAQPILRVVFLALVLIGANAMLPPFWCIPSMLLTGTSAAAAIGLINALGNTGGFIGPYLVGFLKDKTGGMTGSFLLLSVLGVLLAASCIRLKRVAAFQKTLC